MNTPRRQPCFPPFAAGLATLLLALAACSPKPAPLDFTLTFKDAAGLGPGQNVSYRGIAIGKVRTIALEPNGPVRVEVRIEPRYTNVVYREASFRIEKPGGVTDLSGERQVTVRDQGGARTPIRNGEIVAGSDGVLSDWGGKIGELGRKAHRTEDELLAKLRELGSRLAASPQAQRSVEAARRLAEWIASEGAAKAGQLGREARDRIEAQAKALKEQLEQDGRIEDAKRFWTDFTRWLTNTTKP
jgi:hypothetical protein